MQGRVRGLPEVVKAEKPDGDVLDKVQGAGRKPQSREGVITEISDKDYRSFCYPCYTMDEALDETTNRKQGD